MGRPVLAVTAVAALALALDGCGATPASQSPAPRTHTYYIAADPVEWDYAPSGKDLITGEEFADAGDRTANGLPLYHNVRTDPGASVRGLGHRYGKVLYREYTDSSFGELRPRPREWEHLGYLGPLLRAQVGDTIRVVFRNHADRAYSVHPHGVFYDKDSEGTPYEDGTSGADKSDDAVPPGGTHVYTWAVPERAGPGPADPSSVMWMYHSHVDEHRDINTGLMGPIIVTARGHARADYTPDDVDRELIMTFQDGEEMSSWRFEENVRAYLPEMTLEAAAAQPDWFVTNIMPNINGYLYGNMPGLEIRQGERVRWYVMAGTNDFDFHTPHWHGHTVLVHHSRTDVISVEPMMMVHADMEADNPGTWFFHCHVAGHMVLGMQTRFTVLPRGVAMADGAG
jgi:FtsP/CotA-like multicopper oxidase with cupredoxin domain